MRWVWIIAIGSGIACQEQDEAPADTWKPPEPTSNHGVVCDANQQPYAPFAKECRDVGDCATFAHRTSACGDVRVIGLSAAAVAGFERDELACRAAYPPTACAPEPERAEDGRVSGRDGVIVLECNQGVCATTARLEASAGGAGGANGT